MFEDNYDLNDEEKLKNENSENNETDFNKERDESMGFGNLEENKDKNS